MFNDTTLFKATHADLIKAGYKWLMTKANCGVAFRELRTYANGEYPDVIGFQGHASYLIEVKISRSDFLCDKKKPFRKNPTRGMGTYRYYMCPPGLIKIEDLPEGWGLLYCDVKNRVKCVYNPYNSYIAVPPSHPRESPLRHPGWHTTKNQKAELAFMYSALRRLQIRGHIESIYDESYLETVYGVQPPPASKEEQGKLF